MHIYIKGFSPIIRNTFPSSPLLFPLYIKPILTLNIKQKFEFTYIFIFLKNKYRQSPPRCYPISTNPLAWSL